MPKFRRVLAWFIDFALVVALAGGALVAVLVSRARNAGRNPRSEG